jgi:hypothetical protein
VHRHSCCRGGRMAHNPRYRSTFHGDEATAKGR